MSAALRAYSWFDPPPIVGEENSGEVVVETAGYIPANVEIEELLLAGERLDVSRGVYEFEENQEIPDDYIDPTRAPGLDPVDLDRLLRTVDARIANAQEEAVKLREQKRALEEAARNREVIPPRALEEAAASREVAPPPPVPKE